MSLMGDTKRERASCALPLDPAISPGAAAQLGDKSWAGADMQATLSG